MDSMRSPMGSPQNQAPPPYYASTGMENKALENSMDIPLTMDDSKNTVYATQAGYGYHIAPHTQSHQGQNMSNTDCKYKYFQKCKRFCEALYLCMWMWMDQDMDVFRFSLKTMEPTIGM